jgi:hypothetical protein
VQASLIPAKPTIFPNADTLEPNRKNDLNDILEPNEHTFLTDNVEPNVSISRILILLEYLPTPKTEIILDNRTNDLTDTVEPNPMNSNCDNDCPSLAWDRNETEEPRVKQPKTLVSLRDVIGNNLFAPKIDKVDPHLKALLVDKVEPKL